VLQLQQVVVETGADLGAFIGDENLESGGSGQELSMIFWK
jgi:hypothetical protein